MTTPGSLRWWLLAMTLLLGAITARADAPSFKRGVNLSHWLSQNSDRLPYAADWFTDDDIEWIAEQGFDHVRIPIDGRLWLKEDGTLDEEKIKPFERLLKWVRSENLGAVMDMHFLPGADFNNDTRDTRVFTDIDTRARVAEFWRVVAKRYAKEGNYLRFEILNEPVAEENAQINPFTKAMLGAIRESNPDRVVYITSNRWSSFKTVNDIDVPADPNVAITVHFYEPHVFTHQRASWSGAPADMPLVPFPGKVPELKGKLPEKHHFLSHSGEEFSVAEHIDKEFDRLAVWAKSKAPGKEIYIGEFGVYNVVPPEYRAAWLTAVTKACARHGFGWAVWDYKGSFAVREKDGTPNPNLGALGLK